MPNPNIGKEAIKAGTTFKKGKSGNPKGRPKKSIASINAELVKEGYLEATKVDIVSCYMQIINLPRKKLLELAGGKVDKVLFKKMAKETDDKDFRKLLQAMCDTSEVPILFNKVAQQLLGKKGFDIIETMLDRAIGKSLQKIEGGSNKTKAELYKTLGKKINKMNGDEININLQNLLNS